MIAFPAACSYRRILELASCHAIVACVAAGTGIGIMPRSILKAVHAEPRLQVLPLPASYAKVTACLVWQPPQPSTATEALRK